MLVRLSTLILLAGIIFSASCAVPVQRNGNAAPGQVQKATGYNPASGKVKGK